MLAGSLDALLDRTIVPGYGRLGLDVRRRLPGWPDGPEAMDGRTVLITGAASGIGQAAAVGFARLGARVLVVGRSPTRAEEAAEAVRRAVGGADVAGWACDLGDLRQVAALSRRLTTDEARLDVVVHNAGLMPARRTLSADGHELMFAVHVLAPFALSAALVGRLVASATERAPARIIWVSSGGMYAQALDGEDLESRRGEYRPARVYAQTKRAQVVLAQMWARALRERPLVVHAMHPGWVRTDALQRSLPTFYTLTRPILRSPAAGADTIVWLGGARAPARTSGGFWMDRHERPTRYLGGPGDEPEAVRARLWQHCAEAVAAAGIELPG
jgi:dehydrogenase/reductase SDR family protein 12